MSLARTPVRSRANSSYPALRRCIPSCSNRPRPSAPPIPAWQSRLRARVQGMARRNSATARCRSLTPRGSTRTRNLLHARPMGSSTSSCGERSTASRSSRPPRTISSTVCRSTTSTPWSLRKPAARRPGPTPMRLPRCGEERRSPTCPLRCTDPARSPGRSTRSARSSLSPSRRARPAWTPKLASS